MKPGYLICIGIGLVLASSACQKTSTPNPVLIAAGDIASCSNDNDQATAELVEGLLSPGTSVALLGDNAYETGTAKEYAECFGPTWGRFKNRIRPAPGNHDYYSPNAQPYYDYFGALAGERGKGYYSYELGSWHIVVLNSNDECSLVACDAGSAQVQWLRADLAAHPAACTLAYWHHPRFSSGPHGNDAKMQALWQALYEAGAEAVLNGHDHDYERFTPQDPAGNPDPVRGIREFVVGTGGRPLSGKATPAAGSEVFEGGSFGVLKLALGEGRYSWEFKPLAGQSFSDSGSAICH